MLDEQDRVNQLAFYYEEFHPVAIRGMVDMVNHVLAGRGLCFEFNEEESDCDYTVYDLIELDTYRDKH